MNSAKGLFEEICCFLFAWQQEMEEIKRKLGSRIDTQLVLVSKHDAAYLKQRKLN